MSAPGSESIFVCYRRSDSADAVDRIYEVLEKSFSRRGLFRDIDSIRSGVKFQSHIIRALEACSVVLVVIGPGWLDARSEDGQRRIDNPQDHVRVEIETALHDEGLWVIPVLVRNASMPKSKQLPDSIQGLVGLNALSIRPNPDFRGDVSRLVRELRKGVSKYTVKKRLVLRSWEAGAIALIGVAVIASLVVNAEFFPYPSPSQYWALKVVLALAAGAAVAIIVDFLIVIRTQIARAGAAAAVFSLVLFFSPADWISRQLTDDGLVSWWKADGRPDDEEKRNTTKVFGNITYERGKSGQAFGMRNDGSFLSATTDGFPIYDRDRTLEFWVLLNSVFLDPRSSWTQIFIVGYGNFGKKHEAYECFYMPNIGLGFSNWEEGLNSRKVLNPGQWYQVAVTATASECELYVDGQSVDHLHLNIETPSGTTFYIGGVPAELKEAVDKNYGWPVTNLDGRIFGIKIYNRALSAAEIKARYQRQ